MNVVPGRLRREQFVKRAVVIVAVLAVLVVGSAILLGLGSADRVTATFEDDPHEHVSGFDFEHRTVDARSGATVITNSPDGESAPSRSLKILFHEPKEGVSFFVSTPNADGASVTAFGLDRNQERITSPSFGRLEFGEWRLLSVGGSPIRGIEVFARGADGAPVPVWVDDVSFRQPPALSGGALLASLATLWIAGLATLFVTGAVSVVGITGLFRRLRTTFDGDGQDWSGLVIDEVREEEGDRYVVLRNASDEPVDLSEAAITDGSGNSFRFAKGVTLDADGVETFRVHESFASTADAELTLTTRDGKEYEIRWN